MTEFANAYASMVLLVKGLITADFPAAQFIDFDDYANPQNPIPDGNILGIYGFSMDLKGPTFRVRVMFGASAWQDTGGFERRRMIDKIVGLVSPGSTVPYVDADTGAVLGQFSVPQGSAVMPAVQINNRAAQFVSVTLLADQKPGP